MKRVYLDWNATAPLRPEARTAMLAAMDCLGNPSSVHAEGRAAKAIVEKARGQVADLVGCDRDEVVFTSGATEGASLFDFHNGIFCALSVEHDCIYKFADTILDVDKSGVYNYNQLEVMRQSKGGWTAIQAANSETGVLQPLSTWFDSTPHMIDAVQAIGKIEYKVTDNSGYYSLISAHKFGGPKGCGAIVMTDRFSLSQKSSGSGQEKGRRSGTENVIGIAGMGAAAEAAAKDLADGVWQIVEQNRNVFEERLLNEVPELIIFGLDVPRLPNTSYFAVKGWKAETQVMQMDLAGFAVSAGSACSSGKVRASRVLKAMGYDEITAGSAIRVSIGPSTTAAELESFADAWLAEYKRFKARREGK